MPNEAVQVNSRFRAPFRVCIVAGLLLVSLLLLFHGLGDASFHDEDEALYTQIAQEMAARGDLLTPTYWEEPFFHKPPLKYWLTVFALEFLPGEPEFQARFFSALAGLLLVALVLAWAHRLGGFGAGVAAVILLLINQQFLFEHAARSAAFDTEVALFSLGALYWGARSEHRLRDRVFFALCLASLGLLKAPLVLFPVLAVVAYLAWTQRRIPWRSLAGVGFAAMLVLPWHLHQLLVYGREFWDVYVGYEMLGRLGTTATARTPGRWVHLAALWQAFLPWTPIVLAGWFAAFRKGPTKAKGEPNERLLLAGFAVLMLLVLSMLQAKWGWYTLPMVPVLAIVGGTFFADLLSKNTDIISARRGALVIACLSLAGALLLDSNPLYSPASRPSAAWPQENPLYLLARSWPHPLEWMLAALIGAVVVGLMVARRPRMRSALITLLVLTMILPAFIRILEVPRYGEHPAARLSKALSEERYPVVFLSGLRHQVRYKGRMAPIESYYLHRGLRGAELIDSDRNPKAHFDKELTDCAVVFTPGAAIDPAPGVSGDCDLWMYDPSHPEGYVRMR